MIKPQWLEPPMSKTNFHDPKDVRVIEVRLYLIFFANMTIQSGTEAIKHFSCSTQLSMKLSQLINMKMLAIVLVRKNLQLLVIWNLLAGKCHAQLR